MQKIHRGDEVEVTAGKDKGKHGTVERVVDHGNRLYVGGVNMYKKHKRAGGEQSRVKEGGIIDVHRPLPIASVALICPQCNTKTRVGFVVQKDIKRRQCKKCKGFFA